MIVMKCPTCGKNVVWDDFQPMNVRCPKCKTDLNVRTSLKESIERRNGQLKAKVYTCPQCKSIIPRRWFIRCRKCEYWLFGPVYFHGRWPFILGISIVYLLFSLYYALYIR